jgi:hypothetical protein
VTDTVMAALVAAAMAAVTIKPVKRLSMTISLLPSNVLRVTSAKRGAYQILAARRTTIGGAISSSGRPSSSFSAISISREVGNPYGPYPLPRLRHSKSRRGTGSLLIFPSPASRRWKGWARLVAGSSVRPQQYPLRPAYSTTRGAGGPPSLPAIYQYREFALAGRLMSYGASRMPDAVSDG